jgi:hypothetical protein
MGVAPEKFSTKFFYFPIKKMILNYWYVRLSLLKNQNDFGSLKYSTVSKYPSYNLKVNIFRHID